MKYYTKLEISDFIENNPDRIIIFRNEYIYDVTDFDDHPIGKEVLINKKYKNVEKDYYFHSSNAKNKWMKYCIGTTRRNSCINFFKFLY